MMIEVAGGSHIGNVRTKNDDSFLIDGKVSQEPLVKAGLQTPLLAAVADGMGKYAGGEFASRTVLQSVAGRGMPNSRGELEGMIAEAQADLCRAAAGNSEMAECGTTLAGVSIEADGNGYIFHVGDSRVLRLSAGYLRALTVDHTAIGLAVAEGSIDESQASEAKTGHGLMRSMGPLGNPVPDITPMVFEPGDIYLLVSDGLHGVRSGLSVEALEAMSELSCSEIVDRALAEAVAVDGSDNATIVALKVWG